MVSDPSNSLTSLTRPHPETQMMPARPSFSFRVTADQLPVMRYCAVLLTAAVLSGGCASTKPKKNPANWVTFQDYSCLTNGGVITIAQYSGSGGAVTIPGTLNGLPVKRIRSEAFRNCTKITGITIPDSVTDIGNYAFSGCTGLTNITIPDSVADIGYSAFAGCTSLASIAIPEGLAKIGRSTFSGCARLASLSIPGTVTSFGDSAFMGCTSLTEISIPGNVTQIRDHAFESCASLTRVMIPSRVKLICADVFNNCSHLKAIDVDDANPSYRSIDGVLFDKNRNGVGLLAYPAGQSRNYAIPTCTTYISRGAFSGCSGLTNVTFSSRVTNIGMNAFRGCSGLTSVDIPVNVRQIEPDAFKGCSGLTSVTISKGISQILPGAFSDCTGLTEFKVDGQGSSYCSVDGVLFNGRKTELIQYPSGKRGPYSFPGSVSAIYESSFYGCSGLTSVTIPEGATAIGRSAFGSCDNLTCVTIPSSIKYIGITAFAGCKNLKKVYFNGNAPGLGSGVFSDSDKATVYYLPGTTGWGASFGGRPTKLWNRKP